MSKLNTLENLLIHEIKDLYSAETQLVKALPKMAKAVKHPDLKEAFESHLEETKVQIERLEQIATMLEATPRGHKCKAMEGLVEEGSDEMEEDGEDNVKDLAIIIAAQKVEHYEIAGYGSARAIAENLGLTEIVELLQATLDEEGMADEKLTGIAEQLLSQAAAGSAAS